MAMTLRRRWAKRPELIGGALQSVLSRLAPQEQLQIVSVAKVWPEVVGEGIARRTEVIGVKFHTAVVKVSGAMWIQELSLMKRDILARLTARLGDDSVRDVRFVVGSLGRRGGPRPRAAVRQTRRALMLPELKDPELQRLFDSLIEAWGRSPR